MTPIRPEPITENPCSICLESLPNGTTHKITQAEDIQETDVKVQLACNHVFCRGCIKRWVEIKPECPICRHEVKTLATKYDNLENNLRALRPLVQHLEYINNAAERISEIVHLIAHTFGINDREQM